MTNDPALHTQVATEAIATAVDPIFERVLATGVTPGLVYGVVSDGQVLHARGLGEAALGDAAPTPQSIFRIASMTKSVTAATVLHLRDDRVLSLDVPVVELVPELAAGGPLAQLITVRHLLTMTAGFPTDDPWGDRQQDLPHQDLRDMLASGMAPAWRPGERFEYSNLGYAIVGLAIEAVTGLPYSEVVGRRVLRPLGMASSAYHVEALDPARVARGYVRRSAGWAEEPPAGYGAFAPMGGLFSTVTDLARWVGALQRADGVRTTGSSGLVADASLREMQRTQRPIAAVAGPQGAAPEVTGYGFGLFEEIRAWGRTVFHSGGYPGFGSHMRWHPASGLGIVVLANSTYAPIYVPARDALADLVTGAHLPERVSVPEPPALGEVAAVVQRWLGAAQPDAAEGETLRLLFADNVERDVPWSERLRQWRQVRDLVGPAPVQVANSRRRPSPAALTWDVCGEGGVVRVTVMLSPHDLDLVQSLVLRPTGGSDGGDAENAPATMAATTTEWF